MNSDLETRLEHDSSEHRFNSQGERKIAGFLDSCSIRYLYEHGVYVVDRDKPRIWYPDFYLPEFAAYIEYYGMAGHPDYDAGIRRKTAAYAANGLDVIPIYPSSFRTDWQAYLMDELRGITARRARTLECKGRQRGYGPPMGAANSGKMGRYARHGSGAY